VAAQKNCGGRVIKRDPILCCTDGVVTTTTTTLPPPPPNPVLPVDGAGCTTPDGLQGNCISKINLLKNDISNGLKNNNQLIFQISNNVIQFWTN
jgi:hypothetical protein